MVLALRSDADTNELGKEFVYYQDGVFEMIKNTNTGSVQAPCVLTKQHALRYFSGPGTWPVFCQLMDSHCAWGIYTNLEMCINILYSIEKISQLSKAIKVKVCGIREKFETILEEMHTDPDIELHRSPTGLGDQAVGDAQVAVADQVFDLHEEIRWKSEGYNLSLSAATYLYRRVLSPCLLMRISIDPPCACSLLLTACMRLPPG